jgi:hypothetical protein
MIFAGLSAQLRDFGGFSTRRFSSGFGPEFLVDVV